jgi:inositol 1,4,5-triphosphate receptor type 1/inositol 1,4,5-triphosphate receptor type 3
VILHQEPHKRDESVFKLYSSNSNDVWEISFVLSCIKTLSNYLSDIKGFVVNDPNINKELIKDFN